MYDKTMVDTPEKALSIINELISLNKKLEDKVDEYRFDELTSLMTRRDHSSLLKAMYKSMADNNIPFMYAILDLNNLKRINTNEGTLMGDLYIKTVADDLVNTFKECYVFRTGGDEFAVIRKGDCVEKFNDKLNTIPNVEFGYVCVSDTVTFPNMDSVITEADSIMIIKKANGKSRRSNDNK